MDYRRIRNLCSWVYYWDDRYEYEYNEHGALLGPYVWIPGGSLRGVLSPTIVPRLLSSIDYYHYRRSRFVPGYFGYYCVRQYLSFDFNPDDDDWRSVDGHDAHYVQVHFLPGPWLSIPRRRR